MSPPAGNSSLFEATCYSPPQFPAGRHTATGTPVGPGSIAVDPAVIPLGSHLHIGGYGPGVAVDTGGAIRGRRIDVWLPSFSACVQWGRRLVTVTVG